MDHGRIRRVIDRVRAGEGVVKWHEPYFIQLQPDKHIHLNFWGSPFEETPELFAPMHTHDYGFTSHVVFGTLFNTRAQVAFSPKGEYRRYAVVEKDWSRFLEFKATGESMTIVKSRMETNNAGAVYSMDPRDWHSTRVIAPAISYLDMWDHAPLPYSVLAAEGQIFTESNRFVEDARLLDLWKQVDAMCDLAGIK